MRLTCGGSIRSITPENSAQPRRQRMFFTLCWECRVEVVFRERLEDRGYRLGEVFGPSIFVGAFAVGIFATYSTRVRSTFIGGQKFEAGCANSIPTSVSLADYCEVSRLNPLGRSLRHSLSSAVSIPPRCQEPSHAITIDTLILARCY
jgi:hypothetical protein